MHFRRAEARKAMTDHEIAQEGIFRQGERLKAERLAWEAAGDLAQFFGSIVTDSRPSQLR
jgi:hypothetical protein